MGPERDSEPGEDLGDVALDDLDDEDVDVGEGLDATRAELDRAAHGAARSEEE